MSMQYPLLFPYEEDGYRVDIEYINIDSQKTNTRRFVTMREYYAYWLQQRLIEATTLLNGGFQ